MGFTYSTGKFKILMFGGNSPSGSLNDTWVWDGSWRVQSPGTSPSARYGPSLASLNVATFLFGGIGKGVNHNDTWFWK
jgi:hypothetical protein